MNIWLHRISHHAEVAYPLLKRGFLSTGFCCFIEPEFIAESCSKNGWLAFENHFKNIYGRQKRRYNLWRFIAEMHQGDWVVVPSMGTFSIYELTEEMARSIKELDITDIKDWNEDKIKIRKGGLLEDQYESTIDLGLVRKVKPIKEDIPIQAYVDPVLRSHMKLRNTTVNITDLKSSVEKALSAFEKQVPFSNYSQIIEKTSQNILDTTRMELPPEKFASLVRWYFLKIGASEVFIPTKNENCKDGEADVIAIFEPIRTIIYAELIFLPSKKINWAFKLIDDYWNPYDIMDDGYSKINWVISFADNYSQKSSILAKEKKVQLIDGKQFAKMLMETGIGNLNKII